jgi:predicted ester cyclase
LGEYIVSDLKNKAVSLLLDVWQNGDFSKLPELCQPDVQRYHDRHGAIGLDQFRIAIEYYRHAFSDLAYDIKSIIAEGNSVAVVYTTTGTHTGPLGHIPATGQRDTIWSIDMFEFRDGLISAVYMSFDELGLLIKLGVMGG